MEKVTRTKRWHAHKQEECTEKRDEDKLICCRRAERGIRRRMIKLDVVVVVVVVVRVQVPSSCSRGSSSYYIILLSGWSCAHPRLCNYPSPSPPACPGRRSAARRSPHKQASSGLPPPGQGVAVACERQTRSAPLRVRP